MMLRIVALGNELYGDDGVGPVVLNELRKQVGVDSAELINAGSDAFVLLDYLLKTDPVIIIDCARMGKEPGAILKFRTSQIQPQWISNNLSLHGFSIGDILTMARELDSSAESVIIGIEPKSIVFNTGLSAEISRNIPAIIDLVREEITNYAKKSINH
jgi:hydrogenase maturation protease